MAKRTLNDVTQLNIGQYVTLKLSHYPKYKSDTWVITERYLVGQAWRYDVENVTRQYSRFTEMKRLFAEDLQAAPLQLTLPIAPPST